MSEFNPKDYRTYGLGAIYKEDLNDYVVSGDLLSKTGATTAVDNLPVSFELPRIPIKNQQSVNSCVAHAIAEFFEITEADEKGYYTPFSTGFIYSYRLPGQYGGEGMYPNEALSFAQKIGMVPRDMYPEDLEISVGRTVFAARKAECVKEAANYKLETFAKITSNNNVKISLVTNKTPVIIICNIYDSFYKTGADGIVPNNSGNICGSHAMLIVGYIAINGATYWVVQNSWGKEWAKNGYCYIKLNHPCITALYTAVNADNVATNFNDVEATRWSKESIDKCAKAGLLVGDNKGNFNPTGYVTREQMATILCRIMKFVGKH